MGKKRIYEVAKEYGKSTNEVLDLLKRHNIEKSNFSAVDDSDLVIIDKEYNKKPPVPAKKEVVKKEQPVNMQKQQVKKPEQNGMNKNVPQHNQNTRSNEGKMQQRNNNNNRNNQNAQQNRGGQAVHTDNRKIRMRIIASSVLATMLRKTSLPAITITVMHKAMRSIIVRILTMVLLITEITEIIISTIKTTARISRRLKAPMQLRKADLTAVPDIK